MRITVLADEPREDPAIRYTFDGDLVRIGRRRSCEVRLPDRAVSLEHARITRAGGRCALVDADSTNGTFVAGARLRAGRPQELQTGDVIRVGPFRLLFETDVTDGETTSQDTASFARRMLRGTGVATECPYIEVCSGSHAGARLRLTPREHAEPYTIGRSQRCDLVLLDADASREHVELVSGFSDVRLRDRASKNGVRINGRAPDEDQVLRHGDRIHIGATQLRYCDPEEERLDALTRLPDADVEVPAWRLERAALVLAATALGLCVAFWTWWSG